MTFLNAQSSPLQKSSWVVPLCNAKEIVPLLGRVMDLVTAVQRFVAPVLAGVTLVVV